MAHMRSVYFAPSRDSAAPNGDAEPSRRESAPALDQRSKDFLGWIWSVRPCFICATTGACEHREPEIDVAEAEGWHLRLSRSYKRRPAAGTHQTRIGAAA